MKVRELGVGDLALVMRAQKACAYDLDRAYDAWDVECGLRDGLLHGLVLEGEGRVMMVGYQFQGYDALISCFYREGKPTGFLADCQMLLDRMERSLCEFEVENVRLFTSVNNPKYVKLRRLFQRLGFEADMLRMGKRLKRLTGAKHGIVH